MDDSVTLGRTRGLAAGVVCAFGTTWAHTALSGHGFGATTVVVALGCVAVCVALARRPLALPVLLAICLGGQGLAHAAMSLAPGMSGMSGMSDMSGHAGHAGHAGDLASGGVPMLLAHVAAALVTALLARGGERALLDLARRLVARLLPRLPDTPAGPPATRRLLVPRGVTPRGRRVEVTRASRAPPRADVVLLPC